MNLNTRYGKKQRNYIRLMNKIKKLNKKEGDRHKWKKEIQIGVSKLNQPKMLLLRIKMHGSARPSNKKINNLKSQYKLKKHKIVGLKKRRIKILLQAYKFQISLKKKNKVRMIGLLGKLILKRNKMSQRNKSQVKVNLQQFL